MDGLAAVLHLHPSDFHRVVPFDPINDRLIRMDLTEANRALSGDIINDVDRFSVYINSVIYHAGARYGIGGYGEHRTLYARSRVFDGVEGDEPRRLHLGLDIWGNAGTEVYAPLDGIVHSFAFNDHYGDYGATLILEHDYRNQRFYSLYGHLCLRDLNITKGDRVRKGEVIAHFGVPLENGHWPPHLHFQLIRNIGNAEGDYPGVCRYSEREYYLSNCPDPDLLAQLNRFLT